MPDRDATPPIHAETLIVDGAALYVRRAGLAGPPLLFVHGWADSSVVWRRSMQHWGQRFRTVAFDQPGHGRSEPTPHADGVSAIAARLAAAMAQLGLGPATLVGHSFGGLVSLRLALDFPEQVQRLVLVDAVWAGELPAPLPTLLRRPVAVGAFTVARPWRRALTHVAAPLMERWSEQRRDQLYRWRALADASPTWLFRSVEMILASNLRDELARLPQPALVITGSADRTVPPPSSYALASLLPQGRIVEIAGAGHHPMEDSFAPFRSAVDDFLSQPLDG